MSTTSQSLTHLLKIYLLTCICTAVSAGLFYASVSTVPELELAIEHLSNGALLSFVSTQFQTAADLIGFIFRAILMSLPLAAVAVVYAWLSRELLKRADKMLETIVRAQKE